MTDKILQEILERLNTLEQKVDSLTPRKIKHIKDLAVLPPEPNNAARPRRVKWSTLGDPTSWDVTPGTGVTTIDLDKEPKD